MLYGFPIADGKFSYRVCNRFDILKHCYLWHIKWMQLMLRKQM